MTTETKEPLPRNHDDKLRLWRRVGDLIIGDQSQTMIKLDRLGRTVEAGFAATNAKLTEIDAWRKQVDARFDRIDARLDQIDARLDEFENRVDARFEAFEKRVDARFEAFENRMNARFETLTALILRNETKSS